MLQRAANNAYSWWWASHIRTKQSKWLEQSLQDMEEQTKYVLDLIQEEGDSFAKRAEMYYKRRPELISYVEESYRAFRALAERYDHISTELQNANNTLATCFPEQFQMPMDEDDETPRAPKFPLQVPPSDPSRVPKVPQAPLNNLKGIITTASKQLKTEKTSKATASDSFPRKSGLNKSEAVDEIDKLQKDILALQTVKEFVKSSYQSGLEKYYSIENTIMEKQQRVSDLQDEFGVNKVIEDDEARKVMAQAALTSCQETLSQLQETQQKSAREAKEEGKKIEDARQRINSIKHRYLPEKTDAEEKLSEKGESIITGDVTPITRQDLGETVQEKIQLQFDASSMSSITVSELAEKIDELVTNVINLQNPVSSQTVLIERLKFEGQELHANIQTLEDDKSDLKEGTHGLSNRVKELEGKLSGLQDLNRNVERQNNNLETHFSDAQCSLTNLSEKLSTVQPDEELESVTPSGHHEKSQHDINTLEKDQESQKDQTSIASMGNVVYHSETELESVTPSQHHEKSHQDINTLQNDQTSIASMGNANHSETGDVNAQEHPDTSTSTNGQEVEAKAPTTKTVTCVDPKMENNMEQQTSTISDKSHEIKDSKEGQDGEELNWQMLLLSGEKDREKILMKEYTTILRNYKDVKKKLNDIEKKNNDAQAEDSMQTNELKYAIKKRDVEIQNLHRKLNVMQGNLDDNKNENKGESPISGPSDDPKTEEAHTSYLDEGDDDFSFIVSQRPMSLSLVEETLRTDLDSLLDENLGFWLRFSTAFHQIQKFKTTVEDLQGEITQIREKKQQQEDNDPADIKSEVRPLYKHLKEIHAELSMWLEKSTSLKEELERKSSSLCSIQEKISKALKESVEEDDIIFSSHQAAKFQGEVLNMKQENNQVKEELQAGFDHITTLKGEVDSTLTKLTGEFGLSENQTSLSSRSGIPLRSFIFGSKLKQKRHSLFSRMHPNRKYEILRAGMPP
ncbi:hypothetical protein Leryth_012779 [Lithospermum erythrorhizon]|nr:hypothetical protein Leryth_012779 [Lithospermum erythrorhizon]